MKLRNRVDRLLKQMKEREASRSRWRRAVLIPAALIVIITVSVLVMPAFAQSQKTYCGSEEHIHSADCYADVLTCGYEDGQVMYETLTNRVFDCREELHQHAQACFDADWNVICGYADYIVHTHDSSCYDAAGALVCSLGELTEHVHDSGCFAVVDTLICGQDEVIAHAHSDECYTTNSRTELICGQEEADPHFHDEGCYTTSSETVLTCEQEEGEDHTHDETCYTTIENTELTCGQEETEGHTHGDECYTTIEDIELTCGQEETEGHPHTADCYFTEESVICGKEEVFLHTHSAEGGCYETDEVGNTWLVCPWLEVREHNHQNCWDIETVEAEAFHYHTADCYENQLVCDLAEHTHSEECFINPDDPETDYDIGNLSGQITILSPIEEPEYETVMTCGKDEHTHDDSCYDSGMNLTCGLYAHEHGDACYEQVQLGAEAEEAAGAVTLAGNSNAVAVIAAKANDLSPYIEDLQADVQFNESNNSFSAEIMLNFVIDKDKFADGIYDYEYKLPEGVIPTAEMIAGGGKIINGQASTYEFVADPERPGSYKVIFHLDPDLVNSSAGDIDVMFFFEAGLDVKNEDGENDFVFGQKNGSNLKFTVDGKQKKYDLNVDKSLVSYDKETGKITYKVLVYSKKGSYSDINLSDALSGVNGVGAPHLESVKRVVGYGSNNFRTNFWYNGQEYKGENIATGDFQSNAPYPGYSVTLPKITMTDGSNYYGYEVIYSYTVPNLKDFEGKISNTAEGSDGVWTDTGNCDVTFTKPTPTPQPTPTPTPNPNATPTPKPTPTPSPTPTPTPDPRDDWGTDKSFLGVGDVNYENGQVVLQWQATIDAPNGLKPGTKIKDAMSKWNDGWGRFNDNDPSNHWMSVAQFKALLNILANEAWFTDSGAYVNFGIGDATAESAGLSVKRASELDDIQYWGSTKINETDHIKYFEIVFPDGYEGSLKVSFAYNTTINGYVTGLYGNDFGNDHEEYPHETPVPTPTPAPTPTPTATPAPTPVQPREDTVVKSDINGNTSDTVITFGPNTILQWKVTVTMGKDHKTMTMVDDLPRFTQLDSLSYTIRRADGTTSSGSIAINGSKLTSDACSGNYYASITSTKYPDEHGYVELNFENEADLTRDTVIEIVYTCSMTEDLKQWFVENGNVRDVEWPFRNNVMVQLDKNGEPKGSSQTQIVERKSSDIVFDKYVEYSEPNIKYTVDISTNGIVRDNDGVPLEYLTLDDVLSYVDFPNLWGDNQPGWKQSYELLYESVKFYEAEVDEYGLPVLDGNGRLVMKNPRVEVHINWTPSSSSRPASEGGYRTNQGEQWFKTIHAQLPNNGVPMVLVYTYTATLEDHENNKDHKPVIDVDNEVSLQGKSKSAHQGSDGIEFGDSWSVTYTDDFVIKKHSSADYSTFISGAEFTLYEYNEGTGEFTALEPSFKTGDDGMIGMRIQKANKVFNMNTKQFEYVPNANGTYSVDITINGKVANTLELWPGRLYYWQETAAADGYEPVDGTAPKYYFWYSTTGVEKPNGYVDGMDLADMKGDRVSKYIANDPKGLRYEIGKVCSEHGDFLPNAGFTLYDENGKSYGEFFTDANGKIGMSVSVLSGSEMKVVIKDRNNPEGTELTLNCSTLYHWQETTVPDGYEYPSGSAEKLYFSYNEQTVPKGAQYTNLSKVEKSSTQSAYVEVANKPITTANPGIRIRKVDRDDPSKVLSGAHFALCDSKANLVGRLDMYKYERGLLGYAYNYKGQIDNDFVTDADGLITLEVIIEAGGATDDRILMKITSGNYPDGVIVALSADTLYGWKETQPPTGYEDADISDAEIYYFWYTKRNPNFTPDPALNATHLNDLKYESGLIQTMCLIPPGTPGKPSDGGYITTKTVTNKKPSNEPAPLHYEIGKVCSEHGDFLPNAGFTLYDESGKSYGEFFTDADGKIGMDVSVVSDSEMKVVIKDKANPDGFELTLDCSTLYHWQETTIPDGYEYPDGSAEKLYFSYNEQTVPTGAQYTILSEVEQSSTPSAYVEVANKPITTENPGIRIRKVDKDDPSKVLPGAHFALCDSKGKVLNSLDMYKYERSWGFFGSYAYNYKGTIANDFVTDNNGLITLEVIIEAGGATDNRVLVKITSANYPDGVIVAISGDTLYGWKETQAPTGYEDTDISNAEIHYFWYTMRNPNFAPDPSLNATHLNDLKYESGLIQTMCLIPPGTPGKPSDGGYITTKTVTNKKPGPEPTPIHYEIGKVCTEHGDFLPNAGFTIFDESGKPYGEFFTDADGKIGMDVTITSGSGDEKVMEVVIKDQVKPEGTKLVLDCDTLYYWQETTVPDGYEYPDGSAEKLYFSYNEQSVPKGAKYTVLADVEKSTSPSVYVEVANKPITTANPGIRIQKVDADDSSKVLPGAHFALCFAEGELCGDLWTYEYVRLPLALTGSWQFMGTIPNDFVTDANGLITLEVVYEQPTYTYYVKITSGNYPDGIVIALTADILYGWKETQAPTGYEDADISDAEIHYFWYTLSNPNFKPDPSLNATHLNDLKYESGLIQTMCFFPPRTPGTPSNGGYITTKTVTNKKPGAGPTTLDLNLLKTAGTVLDENGDVIYLSGAEFEIYELTKVGEVITENKVAGPYVTINSKNANNGKIILHGEKNGNGVFDVTVTDAKGTHANAFVVVPGTVYFWKETDPPEGYKLAEDEYRYFYVDADGNLWTSDERPSAAPADMTAADYNTATQEFANKKNEDGIYELPETGGAGTLPYTLAGLLMMVSTGAVYINLRKRRETEVY